jgi:DNA-binding GntR family transcriptional regulator
LYISIERLIRDRILSGEYAAEERVPSKNGVVRDLGVSHDGQPGVA